jgi:hypothetical protein
VAADSDAKNSRWPFVLTCDGLFVLSTFLPWLKVWKEGSPNFWTIMGKAPMTLGFTMLVGITGALASIIYTLIARHRLQFAHLTYFTVIQALAPGTLVFMALARPYSDDAEIPFLLALITTAYKPVIAFRWNEAVGPTLASIESKSAPLPEPREK